MSLFNFGNNEKKVQNIISKSIEKYVSQSAGDLDPELEILKEKVNSCKGIVVFPEALYYYPLDRPQHILRVFAKRGYLCLFCVDNESTVSFKEIENNLFIVRNQGRLLPLIKNKRVLFLITYFLQYIFAKMVEDRIIWFDIIGSIDKYKYYNNYSINIYKELMKEARIATYRYEEFKKYYEGVREDTKLMRDGVYIEDFINTKNIIPDDLRKYLFMNKKVLGYYGNIDKTINFDLIKKLDDKNLYVIIFIGEMEDPALLKEFDLRNTYILAEKEYNDLKYYISNLDLFIVPVKQYYNELYAKILQASAAKKRIISYEHEELKNLNLSNLSLVNNDDDFISLIEQKLNEKDYDFKKNIDSKIVEYSWDFIVSKIL